MGLVLRVTVIVEGEAGVPLAVTLEGVTLHTESGAVEVQLRKVVSLNAIRGVS